MARRRSAPTSGETHPNEAYLQRELILVTRSSADLRLTPSGFASNRGDVRGLGDVLAKEGVVVEPIFGSSPDRLRDAAAAFALAEPSVDLTSFYHVRAEDGALDELAEQLRALDEVAGAYVKPKGEPPVVLNDMEPRGEEPPAATADFSARQIYLNAAPEGVDARHAWTLAGGRGTGIRIIDCEWNWRFTHEDLLANQGGVLVGTAGSDDNHGTAVLGEFTGDVNSFGITGICPEAFASAASFFSLPTATAIRQAADRLHAGDIILLEIHRPGPDASGSGQDGYIAIEWWPDDFAAIRYAVNKGILVVEAAGNGARNLDNPIYNTPLPGFPATWRNPFNTANPSSDAVLVGAGAPPPGTHGRDWGPDRSRLDFSNHGQRVDCQGWGREVTTTGYGDLQGGVNRDLWYTDTFSGTSSASPIVVGVLGCVQGILRAHAKPLLTPISARSLLRSTGSPQQDAPNRPRTQRIGNRPNLRQITQQLLPIPPGIRDGANTRGAVTAQGVVINVNSAGVVINVNAGS